MTLSELLLSHQQPQGEGKMPVILQRVICEQIICVHDQNPSVGWWHDLEREDELVFADGARIIEAQVDDLANGIEEAVRQGYRPVIFVDGLEKWSFATSALGRHQAFGQVYAQGRDNDLMRELLHGPSTEILEVYREGGQISVPNLAYGQALDIYLETRLDDFYLATIDTSDPLELTLKLVSRLNQMRHIDVKAFCRNGIARMNQRYRSDDSDAGEPDRCDRPVYFNDWVLDFSSSNPFKTSDFPGQEIAFMREFSQMFDLPTEYRGWEQGRETPWKSMLKSLAEMSRGVIQQLTLTQEALLARIDADTIKQGLESLEGALLGAQPGYAAVRGVIQRNGDGIAKPSESQEHPPFVVLRKTEDESDSLSSPPLVLDVQWVFQDPPVEAPDVEVALTPGGEIIPNVLAVWRNDFLQVTLTGLKGNDLRMGWVWLPIENKLRISVGSDSH
ncbi:hypothetical protein N8198_02815 [Gammaproteobacteria bacterium]|nr:hypothetical protein [Gammaproteobacteria bacterium]